MVVRNVPRSSPSADVPIAVPGLLADVDLEVCVVDLGDEALVARFNVFMFVKSALSIKGRSPADVERKVVEEAFDIPR